MNAKAPMLTGASLTVLGVWSYFSTGMTSITALIPTFFGGALLLLAIAVGHKRLRMPALVAVLLVAVLGFAGSVSGVPEFARWLFGGMVERPTAAGVQAAMALFCFGLLGASAKAVLDEWRSQRTQAARTPRRTT